MVGYIPNFRKTKAREGHWEDRAACFGMDPDLFFPVGYAGPAKEQIEQAKKVCATCPVWEPCLEEGLRNGDHGIWGGRTEEERVVIRRRRAETRRDREAIRGT